MNYFTIFCATPIKKIFPVTVEITTNAERVEEMKSNIHTKLNQTKEKNTTKTQIKKIEWYVNKFHNFGISYCQYWTEYAPTKALAYQNL